MKTALKPSLLFVSILILCFDVLVAQTPKKVNTFPEDFVGKTITFDNLQLWPILVEFSGYYTVQIDLAGPNHTDSEWGFKTLNKVIGVVGKGIAQELISDNVGGYNHSYFGAVKGIIIKSNKIFGSAYIFEITELRIYPPGEPNNAIVFKKQ